MPTTHEDTKVQVHEDEYLRNHALTDEEIMKMYYTEAMRSQ